MKNELDLLIAILKKYGEPMLKFLIPLLFTLTATAQPGCPDPQATNYDPAATINDGSCQYPATNFTPVTKTTLSAAVKETSGLVFAGGRLWTHNDGGNEAALYQIDSLTNAILQTVTIGGATNTDWEDLAFDGTNFYIGDFGNNSNGNRTDLKIYKFPLTAIPAGSAVTVPATAVEVIEFAYEDQTDFSPQGSNSTRFDCEAMLWRNDSLHLFTKDWIGLQTVHYALSSTAGAHLARRRETLPADGLITGATVSGPGVVLLLGYRTDNGVLFAWLLFDHSGGLYFNGNKRRIGLGLAPFYGQVEGLCFRNSAGGYMSNEELNVTILGQTITVPPRLYGFEVTQWLPPVFLPANEAGSNSVPSCRVSPNPVAVGQPIRFAKEFQENARLELRDVPGRQVVAFQHGTVAPYAPGVYFLQVLGAANEALCADKLLVR